MTNSTIERVRAKLTVNRITRHRGSCLNRETKEYESCEQQTVEFGINYQLKNVPEDFNFAEATPSAEAKLSISKPDVVGFFELGQAYYVDFTPAAAAT